MVKSFYVKAYKMEYMGMDGMETSIYVVYFIFWVEVGVGVGVVVVVEEEEEVI
jgi:hypothetical protein